MKSFVFSIKALVTVCAETEEEARRDLTRCMGLEHDVDINGCGVYFPMYYQQEVSIDDVYEEEQTGESC